MIAAGRAIGTGLLANAYAGKNHNVTGVEPSAAMLAVAKAKPYGGSIEWVQSFAQDFQSNKTFDLIVMTGHAFQVLLEEQDILDTLQSGSGAVLESRRFIKMIDDRMQFRLHKRIIELLEQVELRVSKTLGDWNHEPFDEKVSEEMIFIVQHQI